jgi:hypothetical protein
VQNEIEVRFADHNRCLLFWIDRLRCRKVEQQGSEYLCCILPGREDDGVGSRIKSVASLPRRVFYSRG